MWPRGEKAGSATEEEEHGKMEREKRKTGGKPVSRAFKGDTDDAHGVCSPEGIEPTHGS